MALPDKEKMTNEPPARKRALKESAREGVTVVQEGVEYTSFACNDYLGLSHHPAVVKAAQEALAKWGTGAGASRLITGNHPLYAPLEKQIAKMKGKEAALVFGSGYLANIGIIPTLVGEGDLIVADKLVHACMIDGALLSGATLKRFKHNDLTSAEVFLDEHRGKYERTLILTEHVFSMDGDVAPLAGLAKLAKRYNALLMVDNAHGLGILKSDADVDIWMGTLSKAAGAYGGYIATSKKVIDDMVNGARSFIFSTGLPPAVCASALKALEIMEREPERGARALKLARKVNAKAESSIVPVVIGSEEGALRAAEKLKARGILSVAIRPPTVPSGTSRLRLTFSAEHTDEQVDQLIAALKTL